MLKSPTFVLTRPSSRAEYPGTELVMLITKREANREGAKGRVSPPKSLIT